MKKVLVSVVAVLLLLMIVTMCACNYVSSTSFLSRSKLNSLVETYGTPQAVVTLSYSRSGGSDRVVRLTYDLLLSQTPIAVIRFIQLAEEGVYNDTIVDTLGGSSEKNYMVMGRYAAIKEDEGSTSYTYYNRTSDVTFAGEFRQNGYKEPVGGYAQFDILSLAMYHDANVESFDAANGTLIMSLSSSVALSPYNYAVFAQMNTFEYKYESDSEFTKRSKVDSGILADLVSFTSTTSRDVYEVYDDETKGNKTQVRMMNSRVFITVQIVGAEGKSADWSKLPKIGR